jgi:hypothetical protein
MAANGSFYQNGLTVSSIETGVGNVTPGAPVANPAQSSFYLSGGAYAVAANPDALSAALNANSAALAASAATATAAALAAASSASSAASTLTGALTKAANLSDLSSVPTALLSLGLGNVSNTSDANKPVSTAQAAAIALKADAANAALTGVPTAPTATAGTNTTQLATTAFAAAADAVVTSAYQAADALKASLVSPALTGVPTAPTATVGTNTTQLATTAFVLANSSVVAAQNKLINGGFTVNQRGWASAATLAAGAYGHDRWKAGASGGDYSFTQLASPTTITIASGKSLIQVVEDKNVDRSGSYTLSWAGTATARVGVNSATPSGTFVASPLTVSGQTAGTVMSVEFSAGTLDRANLSFATATTPFDYRLYGVELLLCQRYFYTLRPGVTAAESIAGGMASATQGYYPMSFPVLMRASPTGSVSAASHWNNNPFQSGSTIQAGTSVQFAGMSPFGCRFGLTSASTGLTGSGFLSILDAVNTSAAINFDAEL